MILITMYRHHADDDYDCRQKYVDKDVDKDDGRKAVQRSTGKQLIRINK